MPSVLRSRRTARRPARRSRVLAARPGARPPRTDTHPKRIDTIKAQVYGIPLIRPCEPPDETCCTSVGTVRSTALRAAGGTHRPAGEHRAGGRGRTGYTPAEAGPPRGLVGGLASSGTDGGGGARCRVENGADRHSPQLGGARAGTDSSPGQPGRVRIRAIPGRYP